MDGSDHAPGNPYEADPDKIPHDDKYLAISPLYGRYLPRPDDFQVDSQYCTLGQPGVEEYWLKILEEKCNSSTRLPDVGLREAYAVGRAAIFVAEPKEHMEVGANVNTVNENEMCSMKCASGKIGVPVPDVLFNGKVGSKHVFVTSRIPGVSLEVAWPFLSSKQKIAFKQQVRDILQRLRRVVTFDKAEPSYAFHDEYAIELRELSELEYDLLFTGAQKDELCLMHNDLVRSNIIVNNEQIVGVIGWGSAGFFGLPRSREVHRQVRCKGENATSPEDRWSDLYDVDLSATDGLRPDIKIKTELSPRKSEALQSPSSSKQASPTPTTVAAKKRSAPSTKKLEKKGTASHKPVPKRRKLNAETDSANTTPAPGRRSGTPASSRASKTPAPRNRKQDSASVAGSPAPEALKGKASDAQEDEGSDSDEDNDNELFCICRRPDNHTWMIGCDGDCQDWYHGKCVNIQQRDGELIDKYICPNCDAAGKGHTTWKPMCRLPGCRKPARVSAKSPSKYCTDDHGREFFRVMSTELSRRSAETHDGDEDSGSEAMDGNDIGSRGGVVTSSELKAVITQVASAQEFRKLGNQILEPVLYIKQDPEDSTGHFAKVEETGITFDFDGALDRIAFNRDERRRFEELRQKRSSLAHQKEVMHDREKFLMLVRQRAKNILEKLRKIDPKGGWKDICGFDSRIAWSDDEFEEWCKSPAGQKAWKDDVLEAPLQEADEEDADGDTKMGDDDKETVESLSRGICVKKRCERHKQWLKVQQQDLRFEAMSVQDGLAKCDAEAKDVAERAVLRVYSEVDNGDCAP